MLSIDVRAEGTCDSKSVYKSLVKDLDTVDKVKDDFKRFGHR